MQLTLCTDEDDAVIVCQSCMSTTKSHDNIWKDDCGPFSYKVNSHKRSQVLRQSYTKQIFIALKQPTQGSCRVALNKSTIQN
jgi:hypothetical protein